MFLYFQICVRVVSNCDKAAAALILNGYTQFPGGYLHKQ